jgi:hypothetical protein
MAKKSRGIGIVFDDLQLLATALTENLRLIATWLIL